MYKETSGNKADNKKTLKRILLYIRPYTALVILSLLLSALTVGLTLYIPILTGRGVDCIVGEGQVDFKGLMAVITGILISIAITEKEEEDTSTDAASENDAGTTAE